MLKKVLKVLLITIASVGCLIGCGSLKQVPIKDNNTITIKDSLIIKDSTRLVDSIIYVEIPKEKVMDIISQIDTSRLETSIAQAEAYVDTTSLMIIHTLENKDTALPERIVYKDRYITETKIMYRDSIQVKEVPVKVEVEKKVYPKTYWWLLGFFVISIGVLVVKIYLKFKK